MIKIIIFGVLTLFCIFTVGDYSISPDEYLHIDYGELVFNYIISFFSDKSFKSYHNLRFYGGWVDLIATTAAKVFGIEKGLPLYHLKHLLTSLIGLLGCYGTYLLSRKFVSETMALLAAITLFSATVYNGQMFYNPKDIPFSAGYIFSIYFLFELFEKRNRKAILGLVISVGLTLGVRAGGVLIYLYFIFTYLFKTPSKLWIKRENISFAFKTGIILFFSSYIIAGLGWPYLLYKPFKGLYESILIVSNFGWDGDIIFEGKFFFSKNPPWHYLPKMFAIKTPSLVVVGSYLLPLLLIYKYIKKRENKRDILLLISIGLFPILYAILKGSTVYNGVRQFLFTIPIMIILAGYFWEQVLGKKAVYFFVTQILVNIITIYQYYPYQYMAYNEFIGGTKNADNQYELEYWSMSRGEAARLLSDKKGTFYTDSPLSTFQGYLPDGLSYLNSPSQASYVYILKKSGDN
jgi:hypothetical protein